MELMNVWKPEQVPVALQAAADMLREDKDEVWEAMAHIIERAAEQCEAVMRKQEKTKEKV